MLKKFIRKKEHKTEKIEEKGIDSKEFLVIQKLLESKKLPLLVLDTLWYQISDVLGTPGLKEKEKEVQALLKEQGRLGSLIKENQGIKQNLLQQVLTISQAINERGETDRLKELENIHEAILKVNQTLEESKEKMEAVEERVESVNREMVEEMVYRGYKEMAMSKHKKEELENDIDRLRREVVVKTEEKKYFEKNISLLYNYLHKMIGYQYLDQMDQKIGEGKRD